MRSISAIRYQRSGNKKKKDYAEITESAEVAEEEKGKTTQDNPREIHRTENVRCKTVPLCAARRAGLRCERENRAAALGMTGLGCWGNTQEHSQE